MHKIVKIQVLIAKIKKINIIFLLKFLELLAIVNSEPEA